MIDALIGRQLANYRIERLIGRGGMAQVYYGTDVKLNRPVAIKILDARYRHIPTSARRFVQEASAISTWRHEHIIQVYYANDEDGLYYFAMEYIDGLDLAELLRQYQADGELMPAEDVIRIGQAVASALDYAHARGVVHRDVKPGNVLVSRDNRVVLTDFGLAMDTGQGSIGQIFGTPHYIAPEQARRSADATSQSDLYSFGVVLYEMLTNHVPFDDLTPTNLALQHITQPPPPPRTFNPVLSAEIEKILLKALSKDPTQRYTNGTELMDVLEKALRRKPRSKPRELPPMPANVEREMSAKSVEERVSAYNHNTIVRAPNSMTVLQIAPPKSHLRATPRQNRGLLAKFFSALLGSVLMLAASAGVLFLLSQEDNNAAVQSTEADSTSTPSAETAVVTQPTTQTENLAEGVSLLFRYNGENFYLINTSTQPINSLGRVFFESVNAQDTVIARMFASRWTNTVETLQPTQCFSAEFYVSEELPIGCERRTAYVAVSATSDFLFWQRQNDAQEFRVIFIEQEIGRCPTVAPDENTWAECRVNLP